MYVHDSKRRPLCGSVITGAETEKAVETVSIINYAK